MKTKRRKLKNKKPLKKFIFAQKNNMKIGIIGIGKMGKFHAKTVQNNEETDLTGIYDIDDSAAEQFINSEKEKGIDIKKFYSLKEIVLANDAVIIATPATTHYEVIKSVYSISSIHILCEKPITTAMEDYDALFFKNLSSSFALNIGLCERHGELINFLKPLDYDKINKFTFVRHNTTNRNTDVNLIWDTMIHDIDLLFYLFPLFKANRITIKKDEYINGELKHLICSSNREKVIFDCAKGMDKVQRYLTVKLNDGTMLKYDFINLTIEYGTYNTVVLTANIQPNIKDKLSIQLEHFIAAIRGENSNNAYLYDVNRCMALAYMIDQKLKNDNKRTI